MKTIRKIDSLGRFVLPKEMCDALGWTKDTKLAVSLRDKTLLLQENQDSCFACGSEHDVLPIHERFICKKCVVEVTTQK